MGKPKRDKPTEQELRRIYDETNDADQFTCTGCLMISAMKAHAFAQRDAMRAALAWMSIVNIGPGGYPRQVVQRVASVAARGGDWMAVVTAHRAKAKP